MEPSDKRDGGRLQGGPIGRCGKAGTKNQELRPGVSGCLEALPQGRHHRDGITMDPNNHLGNGE